MALEEVVVLTPLKEVVAPALLEDANVPATLVEEEVEEPLTLDCQGGSAAQESEATALLWRRLLRRRCWKMLWRRHHWRRC